MEKIAFLIGPVTVYWSAIVMTLAAAAAVCAFLALYLGKSGRTAAGAIYVPLAMLLSLALARLAHWYCRPDSYVSLRSAMNLLNPGGFALMGVFGGCLLAAVLLRLVRLTDNLPELLDCVSLAGGVGIAAGRLASFFNASDRGMIMTSVTSLPWAAPVTNPVSGAVEYRLATFLLQAVAVGAITLVLLIFYLAGQRKGNRKDGDTALLFLLCYGGSQVVLDSTRYDSLYFRSNGFVSVVQVLGTVAMAAAVIGFSVRLVRGGGWKRWYFPLWLAIGGCFGLAGYMEYHVQRHGSEAVFAYSVMSGALLGVLALMAVICILADRAEKKQERHLFAMEGTGGVLWKK